MKLRMLIVLNWLLICIYCLLVVYSLGLFIAVEIFNQIVFRKYLFEILADRKVMLEARKNR